MYTLPAPYELRPRDAADQEFLEELYFSSREDLHQAVPDPAMLRQLIAMQYRMQQAGVQQNYPDAQHLVLRREGRRIGCLVVHSGPDGLRVVDVAVAPQERRQGAAKAVLRAVQGAAAARGAPVGLAVAKSNQAARGLYLALGFTVVSQDPVVEQMGWTAPA